MTILKPRPEDGLMTSVEASSGGAGMTYGTVFDYRDEVRTM